MKYLGRFEVKLFANGEDFQSAVRLELPAVPKGAIAGGVMTLILRLTELDPAFMAILAKMMTAYLDGKMDVWKAEDEK